MCPSLFLDAVCVDDIGWHGVIHHNVEMCFIQQTVAEYRYN